ncbi:MAG: type II toxin-antitoxin system RelE/ParE family toxin [Bacteroidetes bacterium]|nr:type II toxin-antitoxin system RelE/ParE family toxin [Bacteroidota bacterium]
MAPRQVGAGCLGDRADNSTASQDVQKRIRKAIGELGEEPRPPGVSKLRGYNDRWRVRVGQYRIIYEIDDQVLRVLVLTISDRSQSYTKRYR